MDCFGLILLAEAFGWDKQLCKGLVMAAVIVINYILEKYLVFRMKKAASGI